MGTITAKATQKSQIQQLCIGNQQKPHQSDMENANPLPRRPRIISVGSGKGGVGKTVFSILLGSRLAQLNKNTVIVDADFSGSNVHTCLDTFDGENTIKDFINGYHRNINRATLETRHKNLHIVCGSPGLLGAGNFSYWQKKKIITNLRKLEADYVIVDLAAGTGYNELDLFLAADDGIVITQSDPCSLQDAYGFIRASLLRKIQRTFNHWPELLQMLNKWGTNHQRQLNRSMVSMLDDVPGLDNNWRRLIVGIMKSFRPNLVLNSIRGGDDTRQVQALRLYVNEILNVRLENWAKIRFDPKIRSAVMKGDLSLLFQDFGQAWHDIDRLIHERIIDRGNNSEITNVVWIENKLKKLLNDPELVRICNYRCVAWNCCDKRHGGLPCEKIPYRQKSIAA